MSNQEILLHCAPTLANVKIGNIFTIKCSEMSSLLQYIKEKNKLFNGKGVFVHLLKRTEKTALIYVYRKNKLKETLAQANVQDFLKDFGYETFTLEETLSVLVKNLKNPQFPHEIGVFLGYPLDDIRSFIQHGGKNCYHTGCWKVYHNPESALKTFKQYKKCIKIYLECYAQGFDMNRLTVAG